MRRRFRAPSRAASPVLGVAVAAILSIAVAACAGSAATLAPSASPTPVPTPTPTATLDPSLIEHPTGATEVVLRYEEGGGFVAPSFLVTEGPTFSLYGDGTAIFRDPTVMPPDNIGTLSFLTRYQIAKLTEEQIQTILQFAIGPGGLAAARASYQLPIADAPTTTFTLTAGSITKTVSVNGLGLDVQPGPDFLILKQLASLKTRLQGFGNEIGSEQPWSPDRYRGILMPADGQVVAGQLAWPWDAIKPADFVAPGNPNLGTFPQRVMLPADVAALKLRGLEGGARGIFVLGPDGKTYELALRPLLPDEKG